jgi:uncharacterized protein DUF5818
MIRKTFLVTAALMAISPVVYAQDAVKQPSPALPSEILGPPLVAWSILQQPHRIPDTVPAPDKRAYRSQAGEPADSQREQPAAQFFTGTITQENGKYVLKLSDSTIYELDEPEKAGAYEGKQVKVDGTLDARNNVLHVSSIMLLS